ncbi:MAG: methyltransferase domain-containing protein [Candidatus Omnitrophica bacterium]|nr:methyltransferase domain-containing protein [Candidatus Omnitrophota bacterium]
MGLIDAFDLNVFIRLYGCRFFVETGTGKGHGIAYAASCAGFEKWFSCEIDRELFDWVKCLNHDPRIRIECADSSAFLKKLLPELGSERSALFWLDAHFPGADFGLKDYSAEKEASVRLPLEAELQRIQASRPGATDVILVDDLRIYEDGPFENGNIPPTHNTLPNHLRDTGFVHRLFGETHWILKSYQDEGHLILLPKKKRGAFILWMIDWQRKKSVRSAKRFAKRAVRRMGLARIARGILNPLRGPGQTYPSETSKCRSRLAKFCRGVGIDIGFGGDPIVPRAICVDLPQPYGNVGRFPVQLGGDARKLHWFQDNALDFVFSSHLLEDFKETEEVLREWLRVLKPGGVLILFCPNEQVFRRHCILSGWPYNPHHSIPEFSLEYVKRIIGKIGDHRIVYECPLVDVYSWELVCQKA